MPDRRTNAIRTERDQLRQRVKELEAIVGDIDPAYASAYCDLCDLAYHGLRRPDDLGGPIQTNGAQSRPPKHDARAYHHRNEERRWQRQRAERLRQLIDTLADSTSVVAESRTPLPRAPSQNGHSPSRPFATVRLSVRRAPIGAPNTETG